MLDMPGADGDGPLHPADPPVTTLPPSTNLRSAMAVSVPAGETRTCSVVAAVYSTLDGPDPVAMATGFHVAIGCRQRADSSRTCLQPAQRSSPASRRLETTTLRSISGQRVAGLITFLRSLLFTAAQQRQAARSECTIMRAAAELPRFLAVELLSGRAKARRRQFCRRRPSGPVKAGNSSVLGSCLKKKTPRNTQLRNRPR